MARTSPDSKGPSPAVEALAEIVNSQTADAPVRIGKGFRHITIANTAFVGTGRATEIRGPWAGLYTLTQMPGEAPTLTRTRISMIEWSAAAAGFALDGYPKEFKRDTVTARERQARRLANIAATGIRKGEVFKTFA